MLCRSFSMPAGDPWGLAAAGVLGLIAVACAARGGGCRVPEDELRAGARDLLRGVPRSPATAFEVFECLTMVSARLRAAGDPRAAFADVYAVITRRVCEALRAERAPMFVEPRFMSQLAGRFCELYLAALGRSAAGEPEPIAAWSVADRRRRSRRTPAAQHAVLGLNAHINHDLALGLAVNILTLGAPDAAAMARYRHDHDAVNDILEASLPEVLELLSVQYGCPVSTRLLAAPDEVRRAACRAALRALSIWRSRVWDDLVAMRAATGGRRSWIEARMNLRAGMLAHLLAVPLPMRR